MLDIKFCSKLADSVTQLRGGRGDAIYREFQTNVDSPLTLGLPHIWRQMEELWHSFTL